MWYVCINKVLLSRKLYKIRNSLEQLTGWMMFWWRRKFSHLEHRFISLFRSQVSPSFRLSLCCEAPVRSCEHPQGLGGGECGSGWIFISSHLINFFLDKLNSFFFRDDSRNEEYISIREWLWRKRAYFNQTYDQFLGGAVHWYYIVSFSLINCRSLDRW